MRCSSRKNKRTALAIQFFCAAAATLCAASEAETTTPVAGRSRRRRRGLRAAAGGTKGAVPSSQAATTILPIWLSEEELRSGGGGDDGDDAAIPRSDLVGVHFTTRAGPIGDEKGVTGNITDPTTPSQSLEEDSIPSVGSDSIAVRLPAEHEPISAVIMTYTAFYSVIRDIAHEVAKAGAEVWLIGGPASLADTSTEGDGAGGVSDDMYTPLDVPFNTVWVRDYGPVGVTTAAPSSSANASESASASSAQLVVVDTRYRWYKYRRADDAIPCRIASHHSSSSSASAASSPATLCQSTSLVLDGGNVMSDGAGNLYMTSRTYDWNPALSRDVVDALLRTSFGVHTVHVLDYARASGGHPADGTGHIDMFAKIVDRCVVIIAETDDGPYRDVLDDAADYFRGVECHRQSSRVGTDGGGGGHAEGEEELEEVEGDKKAEETKTAKTYYDVYRIPGWVRNGIWYTYTNSLLVDAGGGGGAGSGYNGTVIVPSYASGQDDVARAVYERALPHSTVAFVNTDDAIRYGGSVHCMTRQIPALS